MHNALAVLSILFFTSSTTALYFPQFRLTPSPSPKAIHPEFTNKCTFTLWQKQLCTAGTKSNYIQLNEIQDNPNDITIDIAALRPASSRNSYTKISTKHVFAIEGLLDDKSLTIRGSNVDDDDVLFEHDGVWFTSDVYKNNNRAWCVAEAWDNEDWECGAGSRVRREQGFWVDSC